MFELNGSIVTYGPDRFPVCLPTIKPDFEAGLNVTLAGYGYQADNSK